MATEETNQDLRKAEIISASPMLRALILRNIEVDLATKHEALRASITMWNAFGDRFGVHWKRYALGPQSVLDRLEVLSDCLTLESRKSAVERLVEIGYEAGDDSIANLFAGDLVRVLTERRILRGQELGGDPKRVEDFVKAVVHTGVYLKNLPDDFDYEALEKNTNPAKDFLQSLGIKI